ncbi:MAG TPA: hypothetical protein VFS25_16385 [Chitinophaga sp.]|uniref:hypothetical protein n=1 Tax=Chitinophaga sp. TaxID=1869181 RepID=UPI002DBF5F11|nr:hypothetical protein [Chitinophaga sp.]HEU4554426.1 hypothetical protein [Chitinophaga sp.]
MIKCRLIITLAMCWIAVAACSQSPVVFAGSTPCAAASPPLPGIPVNTPCELIRWELTLYSDTFSLRCAYGLPQQGATGLTGGGTKLILHGKWTAEKGVVPYRNAVIYRLTDAATNKEIAFWKVNDKVLHLLDAGGRLMVGSAAWSYTLNRIK